MATRVEADLERWVLPPLSDEEEERLRAAGVRPATGTFADWDWKPVKMRPRWLAFLIRTLRIPV